MSIPIYNKETVPSSLKEKMNNLAKDFFETYKKHPDFISRSPGRVNLIGEHIDYCQFSVLPMAIDNDLLLGIKILDEENPSIILTNYDQRFAPKKFDLPLDGALISVDPSVSDWSNYFKCGLLVAQEYLKCKFPENFSNKPIKGLQVYVKGSVPTGSGLSSSAAFVCAVALGIIRSNTEKSFVISKKDLTRITVTAEHHTGVNSGGMDQAASVYGDLNHALYVEFKPELKATPFLFPTLKRNEISFLIANTLIVSNKVETAPTNYNLRVLEVTVATNVLAKIFDVDLPLEGNLQLGTLHNFMDSYFVKHENALSPWNGDIEEGIKRLKKMLELVEQILDPNGYTLDQVSDILNYSRSQFAEIYLMNFPVRFQKLKLYQRAKHVYSEALRVLYSVQLMLNSHFTHDKDFFHQFGLLMNQSQASCDQLFECSCPESDMLCSIALANGSYGSRLTGAGWGGCTVHLIPTDNIERVKSALIENYYKKRFPHISTQTLEDAIIVSKPSFGSCLYEF